MNSNTLHHFHLLSVSEAREDSKGCKEDQLVFLLPSPLPSRCTSWNQFLVRGTKLRYPRLYASNQKVSKAKCRTALTLNRPMKDTSSSNSASMQSLENKVLAFPIFGKQGKKPIQKSSNAFFQSTPAYPQVGATNFLQRRKKMLCRRFRGSPVDT